MLIIKTRPYNLPTYDCLKEFEDSFPPSYNTSLHIKSKIVKKIIQEILKYSPAAFKGVRFREKYDGIIAVLMAAHDIYRLIPYSFYARRKYVYLYDLWEDEYDYFLKIIKNLAVDIVFLSSRQTADYLQRNYPGHSRFIWLPEAVKTDNYRYYSLQAKTIDILSFKRRNEAYHNKVLNYSVKKELKYYYQKSDKLLFTSQAEFTEGLAKAKISVCFPAAVTHPGMAGSISKVTMRYFQSMASKCLIIGKAPDDLKYIFDYEPLIEADEHNPEGQLDEILGNYEKYLPLVEKNYREVWEKHQYKHRVEYMLRVVSALEN